MLDDIKRTLWTNADKLRANMDAADIAAEREDPNCCREANLLWVPEPARREALPAAAKQPDIGRRIDDALSLIETENPKLEGILDKRYG